jgi:hypothetical protein
MSVSICFGETRCCLPGVTPSFGVFFNNVQLVDNFYIVVNETDFTGKVTQSILTPMDLIDGRVVYPSTLIADAGYTLTVSSVMFYQDDIGFEGTFWYGGSVIKTIPVTSDLSDVTEIFIYVKKQIFDVNGDGKTGLEEVIYILRSLSGM